MAVVAIGRSSSRCMSCRKGAGLDTDRHNVIVEYGPDTGKPGCGEVWTAVRLDFYWPTDESQRDLLQGFWISDFIKSLPFVGEVAV